MTKFIRYTLAALCLAASVGCLALWGWTSSHPDKRFRAKYYTATKAASITVVGGVASVSYRKGSFSGPAVDKGLLFELADLHGLSMQFYPAYIHTFGSFGRHANSIHFAMWYPALVFALAGVAALRVGRFTIRSALIGTTIVAALLGMVVAL